MRKFERIRSATTVGRRDIGLWFANVGVGSVGAMGMQRLTAWLFGHALVLEINEMAMKISLELRRISILAWDNGLSGILGKNEN
jgi:hypothetical protein